MVGYIGVAASCLHGGECSARSLFFDHDVWNFLIWAFSLLLAASFGSLVSLGFGMVMGFELVLDGVLHAFALQIQKHDINPIIDNRRYRYLTNTYNFIYCISIPVGI